MKIRAVSQEMRKVRAQEAKRRAQMLALREKNMTLEEIGQKYGVSRQRVYQIILLALNERESQAD